MAEIVLSTLLPVAFQKLAFVLQNKIARSKGIHSELKKWERKLRMIQALLEDASQKEVASKALKLWLNDLQHLSYDIDDFLDGLATDAMQREFVKESQPITNKVRKFIPSCCTSFSLSTRVGSKLDDISKRLQDLLDEKEKLGLSDKLGLIVKNEGSKDKNRGYQTSLVDAKSIVGREGDKNELLQKLLADEPNFSIVPIFGMGGLGKTTLAKLLYNDELVKNHFDLKAWVCVSDDFDSFKISKLIYQEVGGEQSKDLEDFNRLQVALKGRLKGKRFLLVLDDVWSEKLADWETLAAPFSEVANGSKIIITTRKQQLLNKVGCDHPYELKELSDDDALSLFAQYSLGVQSFDSRPKLRPYGEGIVKKCGGLPLALKALGILLRTKTNEEEWKRLLDNEIWTLKDDGGILPALRISYHDLTACCKQLFAYCCLIPKDYVFEKRDLILWWMAEGFLPNSDTDKAMDLGEEHFQELVSRSFFQRVPDDESLFVMHDLMNDLATFVAGEFFSRLDIDMEKTVGEEAFKKYRHMSFVCEEYMTYNKFKAFKRANNLRTFLAMPNVVRDAEWRQEFYLSSKILVDILPQLPLLRVLSLSRLEIDEVPECVSNMKHLRYLNLSRTRIKQLPESICNLYNLQSLIVSGCHLTTLPGNFLKLKNLRHFDIRDTLLWNMMPLGISKMKSLQILSNKVVVENNDSFISWLRNLKNLQAEIYIDELQKLQSATGIQGVNLSQKRVSKLHMEWRRMHMEWSRRWSNVFDDSQNEELEKGVLDALKPHSEDLKDLVITSYGGKVFPNWIGDPSFIRLTYVRIAHCGNCMNLPPLGELPSLKKLDIQDMMGWKVWSTKSGVVGAVMFPCLEELYISSCPNLAEVSLEALPSLRVLRLSYCGDGVLTSLIRAASSVMFPCLEELYIKSCCNLAEVSLEALPSLRRLELNYCGDGVLTSLIHAASSVTKLTIWRILGLSDEVWRGVMDYLGSVEELSILGCNEIRYLWESEAEASKVLVNLRKLKVENCSELVSLGEKEEEEDGCNQLTSLRILGLRRCKNLELCNLPNNIQELDIENCQNLERCNLPNNIQELSINNCPLIASVSFPTGGHKLKSLKIERCEQLPDTELPNTSMLEVVHIMGWKNLKSINELTCFSQLTELIITSCSSIESFPALPNLTSLTYLQIRDCRSMDVDSFGVWPPKLGWLVIGGLKKPISTLGPPNFPPSLVRLILLGRSAEGEDDVTSGSQLSHMFPESLTYLTLRDFEKLETVSTGLQHLTSLQHLHIENCPKIQDLPQELFPSLFKLFILRCPVELKEKTSRGGSYWPLISYIPEVHIS